MKHAKTVALVAVGLIAGLTLGSLGIAFAAPGAAAQSANPAVASGARVGQALRGAGGRLIDVLADLTGLSTEEIAAQRAGGESIADIATSQGASADAVVAAALGARKAVLDERVASGAMTQEQADAAYAQMTERVTERVTTTETGSPAWAGGRRGGMGGGRGAGAGDCQQDGGASGVCQAAPTNVQ